MVTKATKASAFFLLDRKKHLPTHEKELWVWYHLSASPFLKKKHPITRGDVTTLVKEYNKGDT